MATSEHVVSSTGFEGLGDDIVQLLSVLLPTLCFFAALVYFALRHSMEQQIHADNSEEIEAIRQELDHRPNPAGNGDLSNEACPICLGRCQHPVVTNCGHFFCASCFMTYNDHNEALSPSKCPVCRRPVTLLYWQEQNVPQTSTHGNGQQLQQRVTSYNRRFSGSPLSWWEFLRETPVMIRQLLRQLTSIHGLVLLFRARAILVLAIVVVYILSPLDLLPEVVFGLIGFLDDLLLLVIVLIYASLIYRGYVQAGGT